MSACPRSLTIQTGQEPFPLLHQPEVQEQPNGRVWARRQASVTLESGAQHHLHTPNGPNLTHRNTGGRLLVPSIPNLPCQASPATHYSCTAPNSGKSLAGDSGSGRIFFPSSRNFPSFLEGEKQNCIQPIRDRDCIQPIRDTSFSWESIDSQAGSRQSLLDRRRPVSTLTSDTCNQVDRSDSHLAPVTARDQGDAAGDAMDLTRRQREQRKKDIRSKFSTRDPWLSEGSRPVRRCCNWTFVFDPSGRLVYYWSVIVSLAFLYNFWVIIYRTAFDEITTSTILIWFLLDYLADFVYLMDILIHFRTAYLEDGVLQTDNIKLRQHYMNSSTFYIDLLCLLPLDFLYLSLEFQSMLRVCRLVKIYRFWEFLDRTERHTNYPNLFRMCQLVHYLLVAFHWNSCIFFKIHKGTGFGAGNSSLFGQEFPDLAKEKMEMERILDLASGPGEGDRAVASDIEQGDITKLYLMSYYWTILAMTTVGNLPHPTTKVQYLYVIIQLVIGLMTFATVLGYVASIVSNISAARKDFQAKLDGVKTYMRIRKVPSNIQIKVIKWFDYLWMSQKNADEDKSINCLPDKLKGEIAIHVHLDTLKRVEIFQNTEAGFLCELVLRLRPILFSPGDYICRKGEVGKEMYICTRGRLQVVDTDGKTVLATLKAGSYFGEISILNMGTAGNRRTASVRSVGYSDLFVLSKTDMWDVLKDYPAARVRLEAVAAKKIERYKKVPLEKAALPRSMSTPGLMESQGRVCLEDMWVSPNPLPLLSSSPHSLDCVSLPSPKVSPVSEASHKTTTTLETERLVRRDSQSSAKHTASPRHRRLGKDDSLASLYSGDSLATHPLHPSTPQVTAPTPCSVSRCSAEPDSTYYTGERGRSTSPQHLGVYNQTSASSSLRDSGTSLHPPSLPLYTCHSPRPPASPSLAPSAPQPEKLISEIKRLRDRLHVLESENMRMSTLIRTTNRQVDVRLNEIELQLGAESDSEEISLEEEEKNQESFI